MERTINELRTELRGAPRFRCRIFGTARYLRQQAKVRILNVSQSGLAMELGAEFAPGPGSNIVIENDEIGLLEGTVQWKRGAFLGVRFSGNSNSSAKVRAYFRHVHQEVRPVLRG